MMSASKMPIRCFWRPQRFPYRYPRTSRLKVSKIVSKTARLAAAAAIGWISPQYISDAQAFSQKAVDQLLETRQCVRCDLRGASLAHKNLQGVNLSGARLNGAILETTNMRGANLSGARLVQTDFRRADLSGATLRGAHLIGADLTDADVRRVDLAVSLMARAILTNARLHDAELSGARLQGTKFVRARGLTQDRLAGACGDAATVLPPGLSVPSCSRLGK